MGARKKQDLLRSFPQVKQDLLAKKEALNGVEQGHVLLESEIKSSRNMPEGESRAERLSPELSVADSVPLYSTRADRPRRSVGMSSTGSSHLNTAVGSTEASRPSRRAIAQPKDHAEISSWNPVHPSFALGAHQSLGFMDSHGRMHSIYDDYQKSAFSATGNLIIADVHPGGLFLKILNCALEKEESIGDHLLMQNVQGQPAAVFRFPPKIRMAPGSVVTVWAADAEVLHKPPSDFLWKNLERFRTGFNCATILCEPNGQAVAWYIPHQCGRRQGWGSREDRENLENIMKPSSSPSEQQEKWEREQEPTMMDTEWKRPDPGQTRTKRQSFIKRAEKPSALLFPARSAWCQSPYAPTHPHFSLIRPLAMGNDGSSLCRQSRCQSARPDPVPGTLYAGTSQRRNPSAPGCMSGKDRRASAGPVKRDMHIEDDSYDPKIELEESRNGTLKWLDCSEKEKLKNLELSFRDEEEGKKDQEREPNFGGVMYVGSLPCAGTALQKYFVTPSYSFTLQTHH